MDAEIMKAIVIVAIILAAAILLGAMRKIGLLKIIWFLIVLPTFCAIIMWIPNVLGIRFIEIVLGRFKWVGEFGNLVVTAFIAALTMQLLNLIFGAIYKTAVGKDYQGGGRKDELY